jgi:hypothetical protein
LFANVPGGRLFRWVATTAARRRVGVPLALYAFATDWLTGWHGMNFAMRGLLDWPAHLATALIVLGAVARVRGVPTDQRFGASMLACSVLIDLDHLPAELGSQLLTSGTPRPYTHALWTVLALTLAWAVVRLSAVRSGRHRHATAELVLAGAAWGLAAHFLRDIATAPMSFWWPLTDLAVQVPYWWYVLALAVAVLVGPVRRRSRPAGAAANAMDNRDYESSRLQHGQLPLRTELAVERNRLEPFDTACRVRSEFSEEDLAVNVVEVYPDEIEGAPEPTGDLKHLREVSRRNWFGWR